MTTWRHASVGALVAITSGCAIQDRNVPTAPALDAGWQCLATASDLDGPGTVFRRDDRSGAIFGTRQLGSTSGNVPIGSVTTRFATNLALAAKLLKLGNGVTRTPSAKTYHVSAEYKDARKEVLSDADTDRAKTWFGAYSARDPGSAYFLIRETLAVKDVSYTLGPDLIADLGGEAAVARQVTVSLPTEPRKAAPATVEQSSVPLSPGGDNRLEVTRTTPAVKQRPYLLQMSFEKPLHVCFKAERLVQTASGVDLAPTETPLDISSYEPMR